MQRLPVVLTAACLTVLLVAPDASAQKVRLTLTSAFPSSGVKIMRWPPEIMQAMEKAWKEVVAKESAKNPNFKRIYESYAKFRADYALWQEHGYLQ